MGFSQWLCRRQRPDRDDSAERTRKVIEEAEDNRARLEKLTGQLGDHVSNLRAQIRLETRRISEGVSPDGRAEAAD